MVAPVFLPPGAIYNEKPQRWADLHCGKIEQGIDIEGFMGDRGGKLDHGGDRMPKQPNLRLEPYQLVFLDETGTTTKMTRLRGRCLKGQRLRSKAPFGH